MRVGFLLTVLCTGLCLLLIPPLSVQGGEKSGKPPAASTTERKGKSQEKGKGGTTPSGQKAVEEVPPPGAPLPLPPIEHEVESGR